MKHFAVVGIVVLLVAILAALGFIAWNLQSLAQTQANNAAAPYGRGMMRGMMGGFGNPDATQGYTSTVPYGGPSGMRRGMMGGTGQPGWANQPPAAAPAATPTLTAGNSSSAASAAVATATPQSAVPSAKPANAKTAKAGNLEVTLVMTPPPAAFSTTTFDITVTDEKGAAVSDAQVSLDLTMPSMWMPTNKPKAQSLGNGRYQATGRFTMRGGWRIAVIVDRAGQKQTAYFDIGL